MRVPCRQRPTVVSAQRLGGGVDREPGAAVLLAGADHRQADAGAGDRGALVDPARGIAAGDGEPVQIVGPRLDATHFAEIGDDAGEHQL